MWRSKKFIIIAVLTVVVLGATLGGVAIAGADDENASQTTTSPFTTLLEKVAAIYQQNTGTAIDPQELQKAFTQAQKEIRDEALDKYLKGLVDDKKITQEQADQYKAWLESRPAFPTEEFKQWLESRPNFPSEEFKEWWDAKPDIPLPSGPGDRRGMMPFGGGLRDFGKHFNFSFRGFCPPPDEAK
jgi:hypothetical protein